MTVPAGWLTVDDYRAWARISDTVDTDAITAAVAAASVAVEIRAPLAFPLDYLPGDPVPPDVVYAGLLWTNRLLARRNSPDGLVGVADLGVGNVRPLDLDIIRLLAPWATPVVA